MRFDASNLTAVGGTSGVVVQSGVHTGGVPGGAPGGKGKKDVRKPGPREGTGTGTGKTEAPWAPHSEIFVQKLPGVLKVPHIECPASAREGVEGTVVLKVQVRKDGTVRKVKISKGIGHGCDTIAKNALRKARFKPAVATNGKPVDFELRYEYAFRIMH